MMEGVWLPCNLPLETLLGTDLERRYFFKGGGIKNYIFCLVFVPKITRRFSHIIKSNFVDVLSVKCYRRKS